MNTRHTAALTIGLLAAGLATGASAVTVVKVDEATSKPAAATSERSKAVVAAAPVPVPMVLPPVRPPVRPPTRS